MRSPKIQDLRIIATVDRMARAIINSQMKQPISPRTRCHSHHVGFVRRCWEEAAKSYYERTGIEVREAIARREARLRSPENAPVLYVDRR